MWYCWVWLILVMNRDMSFLLPPIPSDLLNRFRLTMKIPWMSISSPNFLWRCNLELHYDFAEIGLQQCPYLVLVEIRAPQCVKMNWYLLNRLYDLKIKLLCFGHTPYQKMIVSSLQSHDFHELNRQINRKYASAIENIHQQRLPFAPQNSISYICNSPFLFNILKVCFHMY